MSADGAFGLSIIAFVGSVFSPYYHWSGGANPENHCAFNVALYGKGVRRWTMTERGQKVVARDRVSFSVGPSSIRWDGTAFLLDIDEIAVPLPRRVRGTIRVVPKALNDRYFALDSQALHHWMPLAPTAHVEVEFSHPSCRWAGDGYVDTNSGVEPIARSFATWDWSRGNIQNGCAVLYDTVEKDGTNRQIATRFTDAGSNEDFVPPPRVALPKTRWRIGRQTQADPGGMVRVVNTLEDTPFYARSVLETRLLGQQTMAMHESMSVDRFDTPLVRLMLPWRMPRRFF